MGGSSALQKRTPQNRPDDSRYGRAGASSLLAIPTPSGFSWTGHPLAGKLFVDQHNIFSSTFDPATLKAAAGVTYFCDVVNGNNANDGLTLATALKSPATAIAKADIGTMKVVGYGYISPYPRTSAWNGVGFGKNINVIGVDTAGNPITPTNQAPIPYFTTHDVPSWSLAAGSTVTYQTTRSGVSRVVDMISAANGTDGVEYTQVATQALVEATAGTWAQVGSICYCHPRANRAADGWIWPLLAVINLRNTGDFTTYLENVGFYGGSECIRAAGATAAGGLLVCNNVEARYSQLTVGNNIAVNGCDAVMVNSDWSFSGLDGAGYHSLNGKAPRVVEIGCRGVSCGGGGADQCSTIHDGGKIIRVGCTYRNAQGAVIADVNDLTESWNLGVIADTGAAGYSMKFGNDAGTVKAWLHGCDAKGSKWGVYSYGTAVVKVRGSRYERSNIPLVSY